MEFWFKETGNYAISDISRDTEVQVCASRCDISATTCLHHDDDDNAAIVQLPDSSTQSEEKRWLYTRKESIKYFHRLE